MAAIKPFNLQGLGRTPFDLRMIWRGIQVLANARSRELRRQRMVSFGDALFGALRLYFMQEILQRYRRPVQFGNQIVLDSSFPPFPSKAFDKRISNYLNNLDMMEIPPGIVSMSTTNACPYACSFCSTNAQRRPENDLDEELLKKTIQEIEALGVPTIILHGGEAMYRYDRFLRLVQHVSDDVCVWTFTTGYGVTQERARELKAAGLFGVWVSLDHYDPEYSKRMRGHPDAFDNACRAIQCFKNAGIYTCLSLIPPEEFRNREIFARYLDFAKELGVAEIRVMEMKPTGREACHGVKPHSSELERFHKEFARDPAYRFHPPLSGLSTWLEKDNAFGCQCRFEYIFITATGEVQPCEAAEISFGNIQEESFPVVYERIRRSFTRPSCGCIPMVMYHEIREYQKKKRELSSHERAALAATIMEGFRARGKLPDIFQKLQPYYERRLNARVKRQERARMRLGSLGSCTASDGTCCRAG